MGEARPPEGGQYAANRLAASDRRRPFPAGGRSRGFTLLELLLALGIFALVSVMAYGGLRTVLASRDATRHGATELAALQIAFSVLQKDIGQAVNRPVRDELGDRLPAMFGGLGADPVLEFTRAGWPNPRREAISELRRVGYTLRDQILYRLSWATLDRAQDSEPLEYQLLGGVDDIEVRFLDAERNWQTSWPVPGAELLEAGSPVAVEIILDLDEWGTLRRLFRVSG